MVGEVTLPQAHTPAQIARVFALAQDSSDGGPVSSEGAIPIGAPESKSQKHVEKVEGSHREQGSTGFAWGSSH